MENQSNTSKGAVTQRTPFGEGLINSIQDPYNYIPIGIAIGTYLYTKSAKKALIVGGIAVFASSMYGMKNSYYA